MCGKAEDTRLKRTVALKFVPREAACDPELCARFRQEAQAAALSHPNVCTVFEIDEVCGFLAMEFVEGETAQARARQRPLPIEAIDLAMQAAQGLQAAHERGGVKFRRPPRICHGGNSRGRRSASPERMVS